MINRQPGQYPHVYWLDLNNDGIMVECAVLRTDPNNNIYYIELNKLDRIDKKRIADFVKDRNAVNMELYDLLSTRKISNGINALEYFHQLVRVITPLGQITRPQAGVVGTNGKFNVNQPAQEVKQSPDTKSTKDSAKLSGTI